MDNVPVSTLTKARKFFRFVRIYGPGRALFKALGRARPDRLPWRPRKRGDDTAVIGCGQYAFATIGYFVWSRFGSRFRYCYDIDPKAAATFSAFYGATVAASANDIFDDPNVTTVYIASNHASHAPYALAAIRAHKSTYVEKPVCVTRKQLADMDSAIAGAQEIISFGFNRPLSAAIRYLRHRWPHEPGPLTISCFIVGHVIPATHWYRDPHEGTRVCGNLTHWLDLSVHILSWRHLADQWTIRLAWADDAERDDNLSVTMISEAGDLISIVLTSRSEPFEGINETINVQGSGIIAKIDDFRDVQIWHEEQYDRRRFSWKDVGHERAILQPFDGSQRAWDEVRASTLLMLALLDMVRDGVSVTTFSFEQARMAIQNQQVT